MNAPDPNISAAKTFRKNGFVYRLVNESDFATIYEQMDPMLAEVVGYEVHKKRFRSERIFAGTLLPRQFRKPVDGDFGIWAWAYFGENAKQRAAIKFREFQKAQKGNN